MANETDGGNRVVGVNLDASTERLAHYDGPSGGWGSLKGNRQRLRKGMGDAGGDRDARASEQAAWLHVRLLFMGQTRQLSPV